MWRESQNKDNKTQSFACLVTWRCWTANFTPCEELVPILLFLKMWNSRMVNFDNFRGLTFVLNFTSFSFLTVKNWYTSVPSAKDWFDFSQMWRIGTQFSQMWRTSTKCSQTWRIGTNSSKMCRIGTNSSRMWKIGTKFSQMWKIGS